MSCVHHYLLEDNVTTREDGVRFIFGKCKHCGYERKHMPWTSFDKNGNELGPIPMTFSGDAPSLLTGPRRD